MRSGRLKVFLRGLILAAGTVLFSLFFTYEWGGTLYAYREGVVAAAVSATLTLLLNRLQRNHGFRNPANSYAVGMPGLMPFAYFGLIFAVSWLTTIPEFQPPFLQSHVVVTASLTAGLFLGLYTGLFDWYAWSYFELFGPRQEPFTPGVIPRAPDYKDESE